MDKLLIIFILILFPYVICDASNTSMPDNIRMETGESMVYDVSRVTRVAIGDPGIADIKLLSNSQIMLVAKSVGGTTIHLWTDKVVNTHQITIYGRRQSTLNQDVASVLNMQGVTVSSIGSALVLSGEVQNDKQRDEAIRIASKYNKEIIDRLTIHEEPAQIQVHVKMIEVSHELIKDMGIDWKSGASNGLGGLISAVTATDITAAVLDKLRFWADEGKAKMLAEPTLVALSGSSASFLAGGEVPVPINADGQTSIQWKPYGVSLLVTPKTVSNGELMVKVRPEVSTLDWSSTSASSMNIPALRKRWAETELRLQPGKSIIIAGLLQNEETKTTSKLPILGDLPIFGELFKSTRHTNKETELLVIVTPKLYSQQGDMDNKHENALQSKAI